MKRVDGKEDRVPEMRINDVTVQPNFSRSTVRYAAAQPPTPGAQAVIISRTPIVSSS